MWAAAFGFAFFSAFAWTGGFRAKAASTFPAQIESFGITNYTTYILAGDTGTNGRQAIRGSTTLQYRNQSNPSLSVDFQQLYQLLDPSGAAVPVLDEKGATNTGYSVFETITLPRTQGFLFVTVDVTTNRWALQPAKRLDPNTLYRTQVKILSRPSGGGTYTDTTTNASTTSMTYYDFTNTVSPDPGPNLIITLDNATVIQDWAINGSPGQGGFVVHAKAAVRRYDDFTLAPTTTNAPVRFSVELRDAATGTNVPLASSQLVVHAHIESNDGGTPPSPVTANVQSDLTLTPAVQLDSADQTFKIVVKVAHDEGSGYATDDSTTIGPVQLFHFNGQLQAGNVTAGFTNLDTAPTPGTIAPGTSIDCSLPLTAGTGFFPQSPGHSFGDGTVLPVTLLTDGTAVLKSGVTQLVRGPSPDQDCVQNICFTRSTVQLAASGVTAFLVLDLPAGFGVGIGTGYRVTTGKLEYGTTSLNSVLQPKAAHQVHAGPIYAVQETLPFWILAPTLDWDVGQGTISVSPTSLLFVRQADDALLTASQPQLTDPNTANRVSNDGYFRSVNVANTAPIVVTADANGAALIAGSFALNASELRPHFPYSGHENGRQIKFGTPGLLIVSNNVPVVGSLLNLTGPTPTAYAQDCTQPGCGTASGAPASLAMTMKHDQLEFTHDGGLIAFGAVPSQNLSWGRTSGGTFAQEALNVTTGVFLMSGTVLTADQNPGVNASDLPGVLLLSGFGNATNSDYLERPAGPGYTDGFANYAGVNFRAPANGRSTIANQDTGMYPLTARSKYYARFGGMSGIHESASFPQSLTLYGYGFSFSTYRLSFLDSQNQESRTDGQIAFPAQPAGFTQPFQRMKFTCPGALDSAEVPASDGTNHLAYWDTDFKTLSIEFHPQTNETCADGNRFLVLGVNTQLPFLPQAFQATLGFKANGNLVTAADGVAGVDSRFTVPAQLTLQGPGTSFYPLATASTAYFNNWETSGRPSSGFFTIAGSVRVPFFTDIKIQLHVTPTGKTTASLDMMGGWPADGSTAPDNGWSVGGANYFNTAVFDPNQQGWPAAATSIDQYRSPPPTQVQYRPRAQRDWIEVATFDYPLAWNGLLHSFASSEPAPVSLPIIDVNSTLNTLSPGVVDLNFAQDVSVQVPTLKVLDFMSDPLSELNGPMNSISNVLASKLQTVFNIAGFTGLQSVLNQDPTGFFQPILNEAFGPVADKLMPLLSKELKTNSAGFLAAVPGLISAPESGLSTALQGINSAGGSVSGVLGNVQGAIQTVSSTLSQFNQALQKGPDGNRDIVGTIMNQLISDQGFPTQIADSELNTLLSGLDPTLTAVQEQLGSVQSTLDQISTGLAAGTGDLSQALASILADSGTVNQFLQDAGGQMSNYLALVMSPAGDYFTADPVAARAALIQQLTTAFLGSTLTQGYQTAFRSFLFDDQYLVSQTLNAMFGAINGAIRDGLASELSGALDGVFENLKGAGLLSGSLLSARITGAPTFDGDSLRLIHLDADVKANLPSEMNFRAFMEISELDSQSGPVGCVPAGAPAAEITLGANDVQLDWPGVSTDPSQPLTLTVNAKWTQQSGNVIGIGGLFDIKGQVGIEGCSVKEIGATLAIGELENYFAAKAAGSVNILGIPVDIHAGFFAGHACSITPILFVDPEADQVLGSISSFSGVYVEYGAGLSLSEILLGTSSCMLDAEANVTEAIYFNGAPGGAIGGREKMAIDVSLLCLVSGHVDWSTFIAVSANEVRVGGSADVCASVGWCPFCANVCKGITVTGILKTGGIDYSIDY